MHTAAASKPDILHALPGRLRLHLPGPQGAYAYLLLRQFPWVGHVQFNPLTGNLLVCYDRHVPASRLVNLLAATEGDGRGLNGRPPSPRATQHGLPDHGCEADATRQAIGSLRVGLDAVALLAGRKGTLAAAGLTAAAPAVLLRALEPVLGRNTTAILGLAADGLAAVLTGGPLALACAAVNAVLWLACQPASAGLPAPAASGLLVAA
jgi:hypothetical protein